MIRNFLKFWKYLSDNHFIILYIMILCGAPSVSTAETCKSERRNITFGKVWGEVEGYTCQAGKDEDKILIRIYRIDEVIAGSILMGTPMPVFDKIFGKMTLIETPASKWARDSFKTYGKREYYDDSEEINLSITAASKDTVDWRPLEPKDMHERPDSPVAMWRLLDTISGGSDQLLLSKPGKVIINSKHWPDDFNMYYPINMDDSKWRKQIITNTVIWKYLGFNELDDLRSDVESAVARVERAAKLEKEDSARETLQQQAESARRGLGYIDSIFAFIKSFSSSNLPNDFINISTFASIASPCEGDNWSFTITLPRLRFDLVTIENIGSRRLIVKDLIGHRENYNGFHIFEDHDIHSAEHSPLALGPIELEVGQKVGVMARVLFRSTPQREEEKEGEDEHESQVKASDIAYKYIQSKKAPMVFTQTIAGFTDGRQVSKARESFKSPLFPSPHDYGYGPDISIVGLETSSDTRELGGTGTTSFLFDEQLVKLGLDLYRIDVSRQQGVSCPRLYVWNNDLQDWVVHGKIIHSANGAGLRETERVLLKSVSTRFRIAEEEPEAAYIDNLRLNLKLVDGRELLLMPRSAGPTTLMMNTYKDIDFDFPEGVSVKDVARSELIVTGYYRRYSDMLKELALRDAEKADFGENNPSR